MDKIKKNKTLFKNVVEKFESCRDKKLIEASAEFFKRYDIDVIFVTTDGRFFLNLNNSRMHTKKTGEKIQKITREQAKSYIKEEKPKDTKK